MEAPKRTACDRCRGQKLRCDYMESGAISCNRCSRAQVQCIRSPSSRMGRRPAKRSLQSILDSPHKNNRSDPVTETSPTLEASISADREADSTFNLFQCLSDADGGILGAEQLSPTSANFASFGTSLDSILAMDMSHESGVSVDSYKDHQDVAYQHSVTGDGKGSSVYTAESYENEGWSPSHMQNQISLFQPSSDSSGPANNIRQISELNLELQELVSRSEELAQSGHMKQGDGRTTYTTLVPRILGCSQRYLAFLNSFEIKMSQSCLTCQRLGSHVGLSPKHLSSHFMPPAPNARPNTQTLTLVVGCFVHILRLFSDLFGFLSDSLEIHTPGCLHFPQYFEGLRAEHCRFQITSHLQAIVLVQTASYLLDRMEAALGCRNLVGPSVRKGRNTESLTMSGKSCTLDLVSESHSDTRRTSKESGGLLSRYNSLDLLETMMRHEDLESTECGRRRLRDLRGDMDKVTETLRGL